MKGEVVWATTEDRMRLHGFLVDLTGPRELAIDGAVVSHGLGGNFYSSSLLNFLAMRFSYLGVQTVVANNRGHDFLHLASQAARSQIQGAAVEDVGDCRYDLAAWVDYLTAHCGCRKVALVGHSLGAIKSLYAEAFQKHPQVGGIVSLSATRLNHERFMAGPARDAFQASYHAASKSVAEGRPDEIKKFDFPFPTWMMAQSYLDKYGPDSRFDWASFIDRVSTPVLMTFGQRELEEHPAFEGVESLVRDVEQRQANIAFAKIDHADHFYVACFDGLWLSIENWLSRLD